MQREFISKTKQKKKIHRASQRLGLDRISVNYAWLKAGNSAPSAGQRGKGRGGGGGRVLKRNKKMDTVTVVVKVGRISCSVFKSSVNGPNGLFCLSVCVYVCVSLSPSHLILSFPISRARLLIFNSTCGSQFRPLVTPTIFSVTCLNRTPYNLETWTGLVKSMNQSVNRYNQPALILFILPPPPPPPLSLSHTHRHSYHSAVCTLHLPCLHLSTRTFAVFQLPAFAM